MEAYALQSNEVLLFKGSAVLDTTGPYSEALLTNINFVLITKTKKMFSKEQVTVNVFPVENVKNYNNIPQVKQSGSNVTIFLTTGEIVLSFESGNEARKFYNATYELLSGKSMSQLQAEKVRGTVGLVDSALGIDTMGTIKHVMENGVIGSILGGIGLTSRRPDTGNTLLANAARITQGVMGVTVENEARPKLETKPTVSFNDQIESLKKFKELLDTGVISQEEFEGMKKQIMGL